MRLMLIFSMMLMGYGSAVADTIEAASDRLIIEKRESDYLPLQQHFKKGMAAIDSRNWVEAARLMSLVAKRAPQTSFGQDAHYYLGIAYFNLQEFDLANEAFDNYLKLQVNPRFFQEAVEYKFYIAEEFRKGARRRYFGTKKMPKWASGKDLALKIYDEVCTSMPSHDLAARAYFYKGSLLWENKEFQDSIDSFQTVIRRFPKHEYAPESYLSINKIYLERCRKEFQNPDLLALAEINLNKFEADFPREERLEEARRDVLAVKELYARGLYNTAQFYERIGQRGAAVIYYQKAFYDYPETRTAKICQSRLSRLNPSVLELR